MLAHRWHHHTDRQSGTAAAESSPSSSQTSNLKYESYFPKRKHSVGQGLVKVGFSYPFEAFGALSLIGALMCFICKVCRLDCRVSCSLVRDGSPLLLLDHVSRCLVTELKLD